ncbi:MAG: ribosome-associated translation inhibitor RaiA [Oscillospiraceae bacterium]|jgi:putative sigma-54 modulation protein|nr:ribosome-associated translation inhibitor RaiA [Oscillospiraceae bacterium]
MNIRMSSKDFAVSPALWARIERKINKLSRYFEPNVEVQVRLTAEGKRRIAELTIPFKNVILRAEESTGDMYQSIDSALIKVERQIRRHRTRLEKRLREDAFAEEAPEFYEEFEPDEPTPKLVRTKHYPVKPMSVEDAIDQLSMLGHNFFIFINSDTNKTCLIYQRTDGNLGLLEPEA